jgi:hypothetical protein
MKNTSAAGEPPVLRLRTPHDVIAAVPYLLGFHPSDSLVAIGSEGPRGTCALRLDLPPDEHVDDAARQLAGVLAGNAFPRAVLVGYGAAARVTPVMAAAHAALDDHGITVLEALRVEAGRFWSCGCAVAGCCPAAGTPYDISTSPVAAQATVAGRVALTGRDELARSVEPVGGAARDSMRQATGRAGQRLVRWMLECHADATPVQARMAAAGLPYVRDLTCRGGALTDDEVAWLGVLLMHRDVRNEALLHTDGDRLDLWRDVLRRVEGPFAAAPGCLTAYAAYLAGDGALANVALDRAVAADPGYSLTTLLRDILLTGVPPARARLRVTTQVRADTSDESAPT